MVLTGFVAPFAFGESLQQPQADATRMVSFACLTTGLGEGEPQLSETENALSEPSALTSQSSAQRRKLS